MSTQTKDFSYAISVLGDAYILHIIERLQHKAMRFSELERSIEEICPATLTDRLKKLEQESIIVRKEETVDKVSVVYELTKKGQGIVPVIKEIHKFAQKYAG